MKDKAGGTVLRLIGSTVPFWYWCRGTWFDNELFDWDPCSQTFKHSSDGWFRTWNQTRRATGGSYANFSVHRISQKKYYCDPAKERLLSENTLPSHIPTVHVSRCSRMNQKCVRMRPVKIQPQVFSATVWQHRLAAPVMPAHCVEGKHTGRLSHVCWKNKYRNAKVNK